MDYLEKLKEFLKGGIYSLTLANGSIDTHMSNGLKEKGPDEIIETSVKGWPLSIEPIRDNIKEDYLARVRVGRIDKKRTLNVVRRPSLGTYIEISYEGKSHDPATKFDFNFSKRKRKNLQDIIKDFDKLSKECKISVEAKDLAVFPSDELALENGEFNYTLYEQLKKEFLESVLSGEDPEVPEALRESELVLSERSHMYAGLKPGLPPGKEKSKLMKIRNLGKGLWGNSFEINPHADQYELAEKIKEREDDFEYIDWAKFQI